MSPDSNIVSMINTIMENPKSAALLDIQFSCFNDFKNIYDHLTEFVKEISPSIGDQMEQHKAMILAVIKNKMDTLFC